MFARHAYWRLRQMRRAAHNDRLGFATPVWETPRSSELNPPLYTATDVTEPQQAQG